MSSRLAEHANTNKAKHGRRRRKKARTEDFSSDSDSSSEDEEVQEKVEQESDVDDQQLELHMDLKQDEDEELAATVHPKLQIPPELDLERAKTDSQFEDYYTQLMTTEFGDDLNKLRQSKDFQNSSLFLLVKALKEGANIFDDNQRRLILGDH